MGRVCGCIPGAGRARSLLLVGWEQPMKRRRERQFGEPIVFLKNISRNNCFIIF